MRARAPVVVAALLLLACEGVPTKYAPVEPLVPSELRQVSANGVVFVLTTTQQGRGPVRALPYLQYDFMCLGERRRRETLYDSLFFYDDPAARTAVTLGGFRRARLERIVRSRSGVDSIEYVRMGGSGSFSLNRNQVVGHYKFESGTYYLNMPFTILPDTLLGIEPFGAGCYAPGWTIGDIPHGYVEFRYVQK